MTSWLIWCKNCLISTRVLEVLLCPVFFSVIGLCKVESFGFADVASRDMSVEACRYQASRFYLQTPHLPTRYEFRAADIRIGQTKSVCISWNPGGKFEIQVGCLLEANELKPGLAPSHCYLLSTQKVTVLMLNLFALTGRNKSHILRFLFLDYISLKTFLRSCLGNLSE